MPHILRTIADRVHMIPYHWQYLPLLLQILFAIGLAAIMVLASWFVGRHRNLPVKLAAYECGIESVGDARARFSVRFYMVAMLFILFDVEAVFMMPWAVIYRQLPAYHRPKTFRLLGNGRLSRIHCGGSLLHRAQGHSELEHGQGGPLRMADAPKETLAGKASCARRTAGSPGGEGASCLERRCLHRCPVRSRRTDPDGDAGNDLRRP